MPTDEQHEAFATKCALLTDDDWAFIKEEIEKDCHGILGVPYHRAEILTEIDAERQRQNEKWGGPAHDDNHEPDDWLLLIGKRLNMAGGGWYPYYRRRLVQTAALCVAAIESHDAKLDKVTDAAKVVMSAMSPIKPWKELAEEPRNVAAKANALPPLAVVDDRPADRDDLLSGIRIPDFYNPNNCVGCGFTKCRCTGDEG